jgi:hypothetical protein
LTTNHAANTEKRILITNSRNTNTVEVLGFPFLEICQFAGFIRYPDQLTHCPAGAAIQHLVVSAPTELASGAIYNARWIALWRSILA